MCLIVQQPAERKNTEDSCWGRNLVSCVAEQLQKNLSGSLDTERWVCQTLVPSNSDGKEAVEETVMGHLEACLGAFVCLL